MKQRVSPAATAIAIALTFAAVLGVYWKGLLGEKAGEPGQMGGGGGMAVPPPPIVGMKNVNVSTAAGPLPDALAPSESGYADAPAGEARFDGTAAVAVASDGSVIIADTRNHRIRKLDESGNVTTIAGSGPESVARGAFADGQAAEAGMWNPSGLAIARDGTIYFTDTGNHRIRAVKGGRVTTVAGGDTRPDRFGLPAGGYADGPAEDARFAYPTGIGITDRGSLVIADTGNRRVREVTMDGDTTTLADLRPLGAEAPCGVAVMSDGTILVTDPGVEQIYRVSGGEASLLGGIKKDAPIWRQPTGIAVAADDTIYIADTGSHCIMRLRAGQAPTVIAGVVQIEAPGPGYTNGPGDSAKFAAPCDIALDGRRKLYVTDFGNNGVRAITLPPSV